MGLETSATKRRKGDCRLNFKVGDVVIVKETNTKAFVEEIVFSVGEGVTVRQRNFGKYSLYAIEPTREIKTQGDWYIGDHLGDDISSTDEVMTKNDLMNYKNEHFQDLGGFAKDIDIIIKNLGRSSGKNG